MAALGAGLPLALGTDAGSEFHRPLGITMVAGLMVSQALTLFTTPIAYFYLDRLRVVAQLSRYPSATGIARRRFVFIGGFHAEAGPLGGLVFRPSKQQTIAEPAWVQPGFRSSASHQSVRKYGCAWWCGLACASGWLSGGSLRLCSGQAPRSA